MAVLTEPPVSTRLSPYTPLPPSSVFKHNHRDDFSGPPLTRQYSAILFDMDGSIIDSTNAIIKHWERIGKQYGIDPATILATSHGRRSIDVLQTIDPQRATWDHVGQIESEIPRLFGDDAIEILGSRSLLSDIEAAGIPWAIVTSGTRPLVEGWLKILGFAMPRCLVTAEDVKEGNPDPACYRLGKQRLGLEWAEKVLVVEDAPAGIRAGKAAGFEVLALATTHKTEELVEAGADWIVQDLESVCIETVQEGLASVSLHNFYGAE